VYSLGRHDYGRLGLGKEAQTTGVPTLIPALENVKCKEVACGNCSSYAVTEDGRVFSWGMGGTQLGIGGEDPEDVLEPTLIQSKSLTDKEVVTIAGGGQHAGLIVRGAKKATNNDNSG
jgi:regulator of chromosome condensation